MNESLVTVLVTVLSGLAKFAVPSFLTALIAYARRPRFVVVGFRHAHLDRYRYHFNIHYLESHDLTKSVKIKVRVVGGLILNNDKDRLRLIFGPGIEPDVRPKPSDAPGDDGYDLFKKEIRAKATWVLQFDAERSVSDARVQVEVVGTPSFASAEVSAMELPMAPGSRARRALPGLAFYLSLASLVLFYVLTTNIEGLLDKIRWLQDMRFSGSKAIFVKPELRDLWVELLSLGGALAAFIVAYEFCVKRGRIVLSQGYLGWHPGVVEPALRPATPEPPAGDAHGPPPPSAQPPGGVSGAGPKTEPSARVAAEAGAATPAAAPEPKSGTEAPPGQAPPGS